MRTKGNKLRTLAIKLKVLQVADNNERLRQDKRRLGDGLWRVERFNKFNPLTYLVLFIVYTFLFVCCITLHFVDAIKEIKETLKRNPFKWH